MWNEVVQVSTNPLGVHDLKTKLYGFRRSLDWRIDEAELQPYEQTLSGRHEAFGALRNALEPSKQASTSRTIMLHITDPLMSQTLVARRGAIKLFIKTDCRSVHDLAHRASRDCLVI